jgi:hypothetical protein
MVINIDKKIFKKRDFKSLNFFIQLCTYKNRYKVYTDLDEDLKNSKEFKRLDYEDQFLLEENYNNLAQVQLIESDVFLNSKYIVTTEFKQDKNSFTLDEAIRYFIQPISIILENSKNDACFMKTIFTHFANDDKIQNYLNNNWIQFENAGGCDGVKNFIEGKKQSFNSLPKTDKSFYLRAFVLIDSDKLYLHEGLKQNKKSILKYLVQNSVSRHILRKRSIENYVPKEAIQTLKNNPNFSTWIDAFLSLSNEQKDFFSIEKGFGGLDNNQQPKKTKEQINLETNSFFDNILHEPLMDNKLINGIKHHGYGNFKENFPKLFELPIVNKDNLKERANSNELENIIIKINKLL